MAVKQIGKIDISIFELCVPDRAGEVLLWVMTAP